MVNDGEKERSFFSYKMILQGTQTQCVQVKGVGMVNAEDLKDSKGNTVVISHPFHQGEDTKIFYAKLVPFNEVKTDTPDPESCIIVAVKFKLLTTDDSVQKFKAEVKATVDMHELAPVVHFAKIIYTLAPGVKQYGLLVTDYICTTLQEHLIVLKTEYPDTFVPYLEYVQKWILVLAERMIRKRCIHRPWSSTDLRVKDDEILLLGWNDCTHDINQDSAFLIKFNMLQGLNGCGLSSFENSTSRIIDTVLKECNPSK